MVAAQYEVARPKSSRERQILLDSSFFGRNPLARFAPEEKARLALNMRQAWCETRFDLQKEAPFMNMHDMILPGMYPDGEPNGLLHIDPEQIEMIRARGSLSLFTNLETEHDVLRLRHFLSLVGNPETTLATMSFPLERGDRPEVKEKGTEMVLLETVVSDIADAGVKRIIRAETHSPVFSLLALREGMAVMDVTPLPLMFQAAVERELLQGAPIVAVTGDDGASEMGFLVTDLARRNGIAVAEAIAGEKHKSAGKTEVTFKREDLARIRGHIAVIPEDILATGGTLKEVYWQLAGAGVTHVVILVTYPIVAGKALEHLRDQRGLTVVTTDGRTPQHDISGAQNFIQIPVRDRFAYLLALDQEDVDLWSDEGKRQMAEMGFCLAPWLTYNFFS